MQGSKPLSIACGLLALSADVPACTPQAATAIARIAQLPAEVQAELLSMGPMSDPGGPFSESDVVDDAHPVPGQRLISGEAGADCIVLKIEKGGRGYSHSLLQFERVGGHWVLASFVHELPPAR